MKRSTDRILSSHIGSLPRTPEALKVLRIRHDGGNVDNQKFDSTIAAAVTETVRRQANAGVTVVNDGEQGKWAYNAYLEDRFDGFELGPVSSGPRRGNIEAEAKDFPKYYEHWSYAEGTGTLLPHICTGPLSYRAKHEVDRDIANIKTAAAGLDVGDLFLSALSPAMLWMQFDPMLRT